MGVFSRHCETFAWLIQVSSRQHHNHPQLANLSIKPTLTYNHSRDYTHNYHNTTPGEIIKTQLRDVINHPAPRFSEKCDIMADNYM